MKALPAFLLILLIPFFLLQGQSQRRITLDGKEAAAGELIVKLKPGAVATKIPQTAARMNLLRQFGASVMKEWMTGSELWIVNAAETERVLNSLKNHPLVEYALPNYYSDRITKPDGFIPNDPDFGFQWHLKNTGAYGTAGADISATDAWTITKGDSAIVVAILDTGVETDHPDLKANIWVNKKEIPGNGIDDDANGFVDDINGWDFVQNDNNPNPEGNDHGTTCAGLIAAVQNNGLGVSGVAPLVKIMVLRNLAANGEGKMADGLSALEYAIKNGAKITNHSYANNVRGYQPQEEMYALAHQKGLLVFASAGNVPENLDEGTDVFPAMLNYPNIVAVGNSTSKDSISVSSCYGLREVDVVAPGDGTFTTWTGARYGTSSGTSASAPVAAGVGALIWSAFPNLTAVQVRQQLILSSDLIPALYPYSNSNGRVNAYKGVKGLYLTPLVLGTKSVNLGIQRTGTTGPAGKITIHNTSNASILVDSLAVTEGFSFNSGSAVTRMLSNVSVGPNDSTIVSIYFSPSIAKAYSGNCRLYQKNTYGQLVVMQTLLSGRAVSEGTTISTATVSGRWTKLSSPYFINNDVTVSGELVVEPGTKIVFGGKHYVACGSNGKLMIRGTAADSIDLTAQNTEEGWNGIILVDTKPGNVILEYVSIRYAKMKLGEHVVDGKPLRRNRGGAMYSEASSPMIRNCRFSGNVSVNGPGSAIAFIMGSPVLDNCVFSNNRGFGGTVAFSNCTGGVYNNLLMFNNTADYGSALYLAGGSYYFNNATIHGNSGYHILSIDVNTDVVFNNSILYSNSSRFEGIQLGWMYGGAPSTLTFNYCDVDTSSPSPWVKSYRPDYGSNRMIWGSGSFQSDPKFVNPASGDFALGASSPAINAGTPDVSGIGLAPTDLAGKSRIANGRVDMGAYESSSGTVLLPSAPTAASPADLSTNVSLSPILRWRKTDRAASYRVQVALTDAFSTPLVYDIETSSDTVRAIGPLQASTVYYWRVSAGNSAGSSAWSAPLRFTTTAQQSYQAPPETFTPGAGKTIKSTTAVLNWTRVAGVQLYRLQISTREAFAQPYLIHDSQTTDTAKSVALPADTKYYWRVAAEGGGGIAWSVFRTFMLVQTPPLPPALNSPDDNSTNFSPYGALGWRDAYLADRYWLQVSTQPTFGTTEVNDSTLETVSKMLALSSPNTVYYWRLRSGNAAGWGTFSDARRFTTGAAGSPPQRAVLDRPADGSKNQPVDVILYGLGTQDVIFYHFQVAKDSVFTARVIDDSTLTTAVRSAALLEYGTKYFWRMRNRNAYGWGEFSVTRSFATVLASPTPLVPRDTLSNVSITPVLRWSRSTGAASYWLQVAPVPTFSTTIVNDSTLADTTRSIGPLSAMTTYFWRLRARSAEGTSDWSPLRRFTTGLASSVEIAGDGIPAEFALDQNFPNPFNPSTTIRFALPKSDFVTLSVFDLLGREVATLLSEELNPGYYKIVWKANVPSGVYLYRVHAGGFIQTKKMILLK